MLDSIIDTELADDRRSWQLGSDGRWQRVERRNGKPGEIDAQRLFKAEALLRSRQLSAVRRPRAGAASMEPWA
jgi:hypothetical protein